MVEGIDRIIGEQAKKIQEELITEERHTLMSKWKHHTFEGKISKDWKNHQVKFLRGQVFTHSVQLWMYAITTNMCKLIHVLWITRCN